MEGGASMEGRQIPAADTNTLGQVQNLRLLIKLVLN